MNDNLYVVKVKNILGKDKNITLLDNSKYILKNNDEKIIGDYSDDVKPIIFKLLKAGFEVSKLLKENVKEHMIIDTIKNGEKSSLKNIKNEDKEINKEDLEKPKKRRGRPPKNKK